MKHKQINLDVDYIGGQDPMTKDEEIAISEFIKTHKSESVKKQVRVTKATQRRKINA
jgi:hypothetical protein